MGELWRHYAKWINRHKKTNIAWLHFYEESRVITFIEKVEGCLPGQRGEGNGVIV